MECDWREVCGVVGRIDWRGARREEFGQVGVYFIFLKSTGADDAVDRFCCVGA